jgi:hypothetical protein
MPARVTDEFTPRSRSVEHQDPHGKGPHPWRHPVLGGGTPLFGTLDASITLERTRAQATPAATHIGFRVVR